MKNQQLLMEDAKRLYEAMMGAISDLADPSIAGCCMLLASKLAMSAGQPPSSLMLMLMASWWMAEQEDAISKAEIRGYSDVAKFVSDEDRLEMMLELCGVLEAFLDAPDDRISEDKRQPWVAMRARLLIFKASVSQLISNEKRSEVLQ